MSDRALRFLKSQDRVYASVMIGIAENMKMLRRELI